MDTLRVGTVWALILGGIVGVSTGPLVAGETEGGYVIVVSKETVANGGWRAVVDALKAKHGAYVCQYESSVEESLGTLKKRFPKYVCFVATPPEAGRKFIARVHQLTRKLDGDPYTDVFWGILTGYDAANALRIAKHSEPLTVRRVASGTEVALEMCVEGVWYCELRQSHMVRKELGGKAVGARTGSPDTTKALVDALNVYKADLFVTSGHATERDWQIGYRYRNGSFRCKDGQLYGLDTRRRRFDVKSPNPKVYMPIGNCLMGHVDSKQAMALAWMNSAGVMQMLGYTVPTWFGYGGWGCLDYFIEQPGRYTFTEAFFANHHALVHRLVTEFPDAPQRTGRGGGRGLQFDRDVVAFYGDPAWCARMAAGPTAWEQALTHKDGRYTLVITPKRGSKTFEPINANGAQRGYRPIIAFLPHRIKGVKIVAGAQLKPAITDNFVLVPNPRTCEPGRAYEVSFTASRAER